MLSNPEQFLSSVSVGIEEIHILDSSDNLLVYRVPWSVKMIKDNLQLVQ